MESPFAFTKKSLAFYIRLEYRKNESAIIKLFGAIHGAV